MPFTMFCTLGPQIWSSTRGANWGSMLARAIELKPGCNKRNKKVSVQNELEFMRIRSLKHEIMVSPSEPPLRKSKRCAPLYTSIPPEHQTCLCKPYIVCSSFCMRSLLWNSDKNALCLNVCGKVCKDATKRMLQFCLNYEWWCRRRFCAHSNTVSECTVIRSKHIEDSVFFPFTCRGGVWILLVCNQTSYGSHWTNPSGLIQHECTFHAHAASMSAQPWSLETLNRLQKDQGFLDKTLLLTKLWKPCQIKWQGWQHNAEALQEMNCTVWQIANHRPCCQSSCNLHTLWYKRLPLEALRQLEAEHARFQWA